MYLDNMDSSMDEKVPLVTIGIPCYNVEQFIGFAVKSVLAQTYTNFELIITDDGSKDHTVDEIRKIQDSRIKLIVDGENHGISFRLNQQIDMAKGDFFIRMDGDDIMFPVRVERQLKYLMEYPHIDVVGSGAVIIDDDNEIIGYRQDCVTQNKPEDVINNPVFIHPTVCGRVSFFRKYKYDVELCGVEDKDLWCRGIQDSTYAILQEPLMFYRDPLKFKLSTYLSRKRKGCLQILKRWHLFKSKRPAIKYVFDSIVKSIGACILCKIGKESRFIANRNQKINNEKYYTILLQKVLSTH